jgi:hypothetical protein
MATADESTAPVLIKAYGEFWNPDLVNWNNSYELLGTDPRRRDVDAYEQRGVYVLYDDYIPVYVGKAFASSIGHRLQTPSRVTTQRTPLGPIFLVWI